MGPQSNGLCFDLKTDVEIGRARLLEQSNPWKYEVSSLSTDDRRLPDRGLRLYYRATPTEGEHIQAWVQTGQGIQPSREL